MCSHRPPTFRSNTRPRAWHLLWGHQAAHSRQVLVASKQIPGIAQGDGASHRGCGSIFCQECADHVCAQAVPHEQQGRRGVGLTSHINCLSQITTEAGSERPASLQGDICQAPAGWLKSLPASGGSRLAAHQGLRQLLVSAVTQECLIARHHKVPGLAGMPAGG